jgi:cellulose synthase/poly-beta-1,6-N-acetylglucosamine synthase-like glycosyltransferase
VTALVALLLAPFAILTTFFTMEIFAGLPSRAPDRPKVGARSATVVIPAHDESAVIADSVRALNAALPKGMELLVIADNCLDDTAALARAAGANVLERNDPLQRGKGFALAFAAEHLAAAPPEVFAVLDADCRIDATSLRILVDLAASGRPAQAINLLRPDKASSPLVQISTFAFMLKNLVRQRGLQRLAGRVHLTGTGMAMPFPLFRASNGARSSIVEDLALGLELTASGQAPTLVSGATVWSSASSEQGTLTQRRRWEGGFLATAIRHGPKEVLFGLTSGDAKRIFAGLDLLVPPLALFAFLNAAALAVAALATAALDLRWWPIFVQSALLALALLAIFIAWVREGRDFISFGVLARLPLYVLWKIPMYLGLARRGAPSEWLRTGR